MPVRSRNAAAPVLRLVPGIGTDAPVEVPTSPSPRKPALDDLEIIEAIRRGDASAASALHDRVRPQVDRTIGRLLGRKDVDSEDLAQLSMIELVRSIHRFRGECSLDTWTSRVTAHTVFKELRRRKTERKVFDASAEAGDTHPCGLDLDRRIAMRSTLERVRVHLDAMEPSKAWTVLLHDVCGYDLREIAQITDVTVAAAQTRLVRGRRELHERLLADPELADVLESMGRGR
jgi:RNA polymerase sigma-70 factor (ECF subfamily)